MVNYLELRSPYGYTPSLAAGVAYVVVFGLLTVLHLALALRYKQWAIIATLVVGGILEVLGWAGRLWSHYDATDANAFIMQTCTLIIGPAFFSAWAYTLLGFCITRLGPAYSLLKPKWYIVVFVTADIVSLVLQAIGGGGAAVKAQNGENTTKSTHIMLAGILFQLAAMTGFVVLATDFIARVILNRPWRTSPDSAEPEKQPQDLRNIKRLLAGVAAASFTIYVRGIYRSVELAQGWSGYVITHEPFFIFLDALPMVLCMVCFAVAHPGWLLTPHA